MQVLLSIQLEVSTYMEKEDFKKNNISLKFIHHSQSLSIVDLCFEKDVIEIKDF